METNIIYNLDCIKNMDKVDDNSVHLILSDIPYGIGIDDWVSEASRLTKSIMILQIIG